VERKIERSVVVDQARIAATLVGQGKDLGQVEEDVGVGVFQRIVRGTPYLTPKK
jgi:hypothetical protein